MPASTSRRLNLSSRLGLALAAAALLAACGGGNIGGVSGSSSGGGSNAVLAGTFFKPNTSSRGSDHVFGAVNALGNGYFADLGGSSRAVFVFGSASNNGSISGNFAAYAANGSNLGNGTTLQNGSISGSVASQSGTTTANVTFANSAAGFSNSATLVLDQPVLAQTALATVAGTTYSVTIGSTAIASSALFLLGGNSYTLTLGSSGTATFTSVSGCALSGNATADGTYAIYDLHLSGNCSGNSVVLDGQASYLPAGSTSPLDGSTLSNVTLLLELSDFLANVNSPQYALAGLAGKAS